MSKFKVGDRVVIVQSTIPGHWADHIGKIATVTECDTEGDGTPFWLVEVDENWELGYYEEELELEEVYNSPLYKALR